MNAQDDLARLLLNESADDEGNARCALAIFGAEFAYSGALGWLHWNGKYWQPDPDEAEVDQAILATLKRRRLCAVDTGKEVIIKCTAGSASRLRGAKMIFRSLVAAPHEEFDCNPDELNVANGVLNLRTGVLTPHTPEHRFTYCLSTPYDPAADDSVWRKFLAEVVQDDDGMIAYLQTVIGYILTGHTSEECLWYLHGPSRSGKGTTTETLLVLLGQTLSTEVDFATFTAKREGDTQNFDLAPLKPARLVVTSESNRYEALNTGKVKQLTGGNYIRCAFKHRDHFTYRPQFKAMLVSNHPVSADVDDDALWYRVKVILFPTSRKGREDKALKARLRSPAVLTGVLRWAVDGAQKWYASPTGLVHPKAVEVNTRQQRADLDMVQAWIDECCVEADVWTPHAELYSSYADWCRRNGVQPKSARGFTQALTGKAFTADIKRAGDKVFRAIRGLRL